ncbi:hypothetical protein [Lentibacillus salinarum]|uniref:Lipoprotein n=1 Tax=Lentibacillus salinarum TaxID=446820 RepID=A0ABW3ZT16_9BACI
MGKKFLAIIILVILTACTEEPVIVKSDAPPDAPEQKPEIVEQQTDDEEEVEEFIEFALPEEKIMVNLKMVPILDSYLQAVPNRQKAIGQMTLDPIQATDKNLYMLAFSCRETACSYLLMDRTEENKTYLLADLAELSQTVLSPDGTNVMFHFTREESPSHLPLSDIVVIDLEKWEPMTPDHLQADSFALSYTWPIQFVEWTDNRNLTATVPDISEPSAEKIMAWANTEKPTKTIELTLNPKE